MVTGKTYPSRQAWLDERRFQIGGSDAAAAVGRSPHMTNVDLWKIKTGRMEQQDISAEPYVAYGTNAEDHLRELFKLDYPEFMVQYDPFNLFRNDRYPYSHASVDGLIYPNAIESSFEYDKDGVMRHLGILEIKTATITSSRQALEWKGRIPDHYYCQVLHYMAVLEADFAILKAQLKHERDGEIWLETRHYRIDRQDVEEDIKTLMRAESVLGEAIKNDKEPALILPI
jgi:putative phage-type endonuclease